MRLFFKLFLFFFIPGILIFLANWNGLDSFLKNHSFVDEKSTDTVYYIQILSLFAGTLISVVLLPITYEILSRKYNTTKEQYENLMSQYRNSLIKSFNMNEDLNRHDFRELKTRIFVPCKGIKYCCSKKKKITSKAFKPITDNFENNKNVIFEVEPTPEGLVGLVYRDKETKIADRNLGNYTMSQYQMHYLRDVKFCAAFPILCPIKQEVLAIVSVDLNTKAKLNRKERDAFIQELDYYGKFIQNTIKL